MMPEFVFLDPGADVTRRDIYRMGRDRGMRVVLISPALTWERDQVDEWLCANPTDPEAVLAALGDRQVAGVVNCSESCLATAAAISDRHGVPGIRPEVVTRCRDKIVMGELLTSAGVPMAARRVVTSVAEALAAATELRPPGVLKPSTGVASLFTVRFDTAEELAQRLREFTGRLAERVPGSLRDMAGRWLVEEFLDGPGYSVESVVSSGVVRHVAVSEKGAVRGPYFREIGHCCPATLPSRVLASLHELAGRCIAALGIDDCVTHTEFKLTRDGPRVLEIGARIGGGSIRQVVREATGVDLIGAVLDLAMGRRPQVNPVDGRAAASRALYPSAAGTIVALDTDPVASLPGVVAVNRWMRVNDVYRLPPDGYGEVLGVVATGNTSDEAVRLADAAIEAAATRVVMRA